MAPVLMSCDCVAPVSATAQLVVTTMPLLRIPTLSKAAVNFERWLIMFMGALPDDVEITGSRRAPRHALDCAFRSRFNEPAGTCRPFCHICGAALSPIGNSNLSPADSLFIPAQPAVASVSDYSVARRFQYQLIERVRIHQSARRDDVAHWLPAHFRFLGDVRRGAKADLCVEESGEPTADVLEFLAALAFDLEPAQVEFGGGVDAIGEPVHGVEQGRAHRRH